MKKIKDIIKKIVFAFCTIYAFNVIGLGLNILIPINLITIVIVGSLGFSGLISLICLYLTIM